MPNFCEINGQNFFDTADNNIEKFFDDGMILMIGKILR